MKKILAFAGSNHSMSIHQQLLEYTTSLIKDTEVKLLDIRKWLIPIYSIDMDPEQTPREISVLISLIQEYDGFIIASPEHNGGTSAFLKNILDWLSRRAKKVFNAKPVLLISTSPGGGGGATHLNYLAGALPYQGAKIVDKYSLPSFYDNFKHGEVIGDNLLEIKAVIQKLKEAVNE